MLSKSLAFLSILPICDDIDEDQEAYHRVLILKSLKKILPLEFFVDNLDLEQTHSYQHKILSSVIPILTHTHPIAFPGTLSFFALSKARSGSFRFFFEMISRWLLPAKKLNILLVNSLDFQLPDLSLETYTLSEISIRVEAEDDLKDIRHHFALLGAEIGLGIQSAFYAQRILEMKGLSGDEKASLIQGLVSLLVKRFPHVYDNGVFKEMQHVLVMCRDEFKNDRRARHLSRIISIHYLFRKSLDEAIKKNPQKRFLSLKIFRAFIQSVQGRRRVLAIMIGVNLFRDQEAFGEKHLLMAIQHHIPSVQAVEQSFFINKGTDQICTLYLEIEKVEGEDFTDAEINCLRRELPGDLKNCIEHKLHPVFMPCNEEEVMRNILILSNQVRYPRDIPQVFILFEEQGQSYLSFIVIMVRLLKPGVPPISDIFRTNRTYLTYLHDRTKVVGYVRKKYAKEANVFRLRLAKDPFLRADYSLDLYKARQSIAAELTRLVGEFRDYNGGMISKQHEQLAQIKELLGHPQSYQELLLENFFYSLAPIIRSLLDPVAFKTLFILLQKSLEAYKESYYLASQARDGNMFVLIISEDPHLQDLLQRDIQPLQIPSTELAAASTKTNSHFCLGYICSVKDSDKQKQFLAAIQQCVENCQLA